MLKSRHNRPRIQELEAENQRLKRSVEELSLLNQLALSIGATTDTQHIIRTIIKKVIHSVQASQGNIMLISEESQNALHTFIRTADSQSDEKGFKVDQNLLGWMHLNKQPLLINDPHGDKRFQGTPWDPLIKNLMCVPLMIRRRLIGVLTVYNNRNDSSSFSDEDLRLLSIIASQSAQIIENARLHEEEQALGKMREELRLAQDIQHSLLPEEHIPIPGYDVAGKSIPAQNVGGDYYDIFPTQSNQFALCVGDASGKGLPASLYISNVQATLQGQAPWTPSVSMCLERVNQLVTKRTRTGFFVTLFYSVLDPISNQLSYSNAGHNRPFLKKASGEIEKLDLGDIVLGFKENYPFREDTLLLLPGDTLLIYSDGITEAKNSDGAFFEEERLIDSMARFSSGSAQDLLDQVISDVKSFTGNAPQSDDMTLLVLRRM